MNDTTKNLIRGGMVAGEMMAITGMSPADIIARQPAPRHQFPPATPPKEKTIKRNPGVRYRATAKGRRQ